MNAAAVEWLRRQVTVRLGKAQAAGGGQWHTGCSCKGECRDYPSCSRIEGDSLTIYDEGGHNSAQAAHIAASDPQDAIARCEAELAILDRHSPVVAGYGPLEGQPCCQCCSPDEDMWYATGWPCGTVRDVATSYRHRDGYAKYWGESCRS